MINHRYKLEPYKGMNSRYRCPSCQHRYKTFSLYIDTITGEHIHPSVGRCNRESNCGYHYTPKQYFEENNNSFNRPQPKAFKPLNDLPKTKPISFIPIEVFKESLNQSDFEANNFVKFLINLFGVNIASELVSRYFIATSKHWKGATVFWQIDTQGKVRTDKIMLYNLTTGKRIKEPFNHINWVHKVIKQPEFELRQCFFGEHLLNDNTKPVAIVESEKTAVIASIYLPKFIWVAIGSLSNLNAEKCEILKGRTVILFPDLNGFEKWSSKAKEISHFANITISDLLERKATETEKKQGFDLADYLLKFNHKAFALSETKTIIQPQTIQPFFEVKQNKQPKPVYNFNSPEKPKLFDWKQDITDLENYFKNSSPPEKPIKLNPYSTIINCSLFIESHLAIVKWNNGNTLFLPYLNRLKELKEHLS